MSRVLPPRPDEMTEAQQAMYDGIVHGPRTPKGGRSPFIDDEGRLIGPFGIWNIAPNVGDAVQNVGVAVRYNTSLPARVREIAILAVGAAYRANFEWYAHAPLAAAVGVSAEQLLWRRGGGRAGSPDRLLRDALHHAERLRRRPAGRRGEALRLMMGDLPSRVTNPPASGGMRGDRGDDCGAITTPAGVRELRLQDDPARIAAQ